MYLSDLIAGGMSSEAAVELLLNIVWTCLGAFLVFLCRQGLHWLKPDLREQRMPEI